MQRAVAISLALHAAALLVVGVLRGGARAHGDEERELLPVVDLVPARDVALPGPQATDEPPTAPAVAADDDHLSYAWTAPTRAPNYDPRAAEAAASSGRGPGVTDPSNTGRRDTDTMHAQLYDADGGRYQLERIRTASERTSREQIRATPTPSSSAYLASRDGTGTSRERAGSRSAGSDTRHGGGPRELEAGDASGSPSSLGDARWQKGSKIGVDGEDAEGFARPDIEQGAASTDAARSSTQVSDDRTLARVSSDRRPGPIELSNPGPVGPGDGGRGSGDRPAWAPHGRGSEAVPGGSPDAPDGESLAQSTFRRRYNLYLSEVKRKIDPLWELPHEIAIRLESGEVLVGFTIRRDGTVKDVRVLKTSGWKSFDKVVVAAIEKASPFGPLPDVFGKELRVTAPFAGDNPIIR